MCVCVSFVLALILPVRNQGSCVWELLGVTLLCFDIRNILCQQPGETQTRQEASHFPEMGWEAEIIWTFRMESKMKFMSCCGQTRDTDCEDMFSCFVMVREGAFRRSNP